MRLAIVLPFASATLLLTGPRPGRAQPQPLPTTIDNFYMRGTQPGRLAADNEIITAMDECTGCHQSVPGDPPPTATIPPEWSGSLMAQAARDPLFYACLDIAEADAPGAGNMCIRCHSPKAWLEGRAVPTDGSAISRRDRDGITCDACHRMVDPFDPTGQAPAPDTLILFELGPDRPVQAMDRGTPPTPGNNGNGNYVVDPFDRRRGPFPLVADGFPSPPAVECDPFHFSATFGRCEDDFGNPDGCKTYESPVHRRSEFCATCHDVSLPHFSYNTAGTQLVFNGTGAHHPTGTKYDMGPVERTYSEWLKSAFAVGNGVDMGGRFGAPGQTFVSQCQDCHMARHLGMGCFFVNGARPDIARHTFNAASTWVLEAIALHYGPDGPLPGFPPPDPQGGPDLDVATVAELQANAQRNIDMLRLAADLDAVLDDSQTPGPARLKVTVTNQTGHKLPTGYPEGRRIWIRVQFFDCTDDGTPILEYGGYDFSTAVLDAADTKVYEFVGGLDETLAALVGRPAGPAQHFVLTNKVFKDNRIPPRGFTHAGFAAVQAAPVAYVYADGQYWDETYFDIPPYAVGARVTLFYQSTSKEYIEFLRDNNPNAATDPQNRGALAYALWEAFGRSQPVVMAELGAAPHLDIALKGDLNGDRRLDLNDLPGFVDVLLDLASDPRLLCAADMDGSGLADGDDIRPFSDRLLSP
ncbi:MAG: hypothetical protein ACE5E1_01705 [Phycisphaerae bacterium]